MKTSYLWLVLVLSLCTSGILQAGVAVKAPNTDAVAPAQELTASELPPVQVEQNTKRGLRERIAHRMVQKKFDKAQRQEKSGSNTFGLLSLIFGILSLLMLLTGIFAFVGLVFGISAFILGIIGIRRDRGPGMAIAGLVMGIVSILIVALVFWVIALLL
jgi:hypothetical protein